MASSATVRTPWPKGPTIGTWFTPPQISVPQSCPHMSRTSLPANAPRLPAILPVSHTAILEERERRGGEGRAAPGDAASGRGVGVTPRGSRNPGGEPLRGVSDGLRAPTRRTFARSTPGGSALRELVPGASAALAVLLALLLAR